MEPGDSNLYHTMETKGLKSPNNETRVLPFAARGMSVLEFGPHTMERGPGIYIT